MLPQGYEKEVNSPSFPETAIKPETVIDSETATTSNPKPLAGIFEEMSSTSDDVNKVLIATAGALNNSSRTPTVFESLQMLTQYANTYEQPVISRKRPKPTFELDPTAVYEDPNVPKTPCIGKSKWDEYRDMANSQLTIAPYFSPFPAESELMTDEELVKMKGPSRLIGFLVDIAMKERARRALRWTGTGLEFILVNKELVARMWGNRKHNTKDMDYYKLSRAIREKYDKKEKNSVLKTGKLKKGSRTYSYVFTENAYTDLMSQTEKTIDFIKDFAARIGNKYRDNNDINSNSPQAPSPQNSDE